MCEMVANFFELLSTYHPGWGSGQYGPYGDPAGPGTPAQGEPGKAVRRASRREPRTPLFLLNSKTPLATSSRVSTPCNVKKVFCKKN